MTEPTRAQQKQVARELLGWSKWLGLWWTDRAIRFSLPAWNSPDFLWPLYHYLAWNHCADTFGGDLTLENDDGDNTEWPFGPDLDTAALAVWAAALAVTGEG